MHAPLAELVLTYAIALVFILVLSRIRIPPIVSFIVAGAVAGPAGIGIVKTEDDVEMLAEMGIVLLLFTVGLEFSLTEIRRIWRKVLDRWARSRSAGPRRRFSSSLLAISGSGAMWRFGLFAGLFVALSSTAIVLKELGSRNQLDSPHGRLVVGVMLFQDLCIVRPAAARPDPLGPDAAVRRPGSARQGRWGHRRGGDRQPVCPAGALPARRPQRAPRSVSAGRRPREHRHRLGQFAPRHLDGARRVSRRPGPGRERIQPPGVRRDSAPPRHPGGAVLHLVGDARRSVRAAAAVPAHRRDRGAARLRQGGDRHRGLSGRGDDHARGGDGRNRPGAGR